MSNIGEVPPASAPKKVPSCWLIGGLGCLGLIVAILIVMAFVVMRGLGTPRGKLLVHELGKVFHSAALIPESSNEMSDIRGALVRYQLKKGNYPASLNELVPDFLPKKSELHAPLDPVKDPTHVSFVYTRPTVGAPSSTKILTLTWSFSINVGDNKQMLTKEVLSETLGGKMVQSQYQDGKLVGETNYQTDQGEG